MLMTEIRVGMLLYSAFDGAPIWPVVVTEITGRGFLYRYKNGPRPMGSRIGVAEGGEHFGIEGESCYVPVEPDFQI